MPQHRPVKSASLRLGDAEGGEETLGTSYRGDSWGPVMIAVMDAARVNKTGK